jgi:hypothetical protein
VKYSTSKFTSSNTSNHVYAAAFQPPQARAQPQAAYASSSNQLAARPRQTPTASLTSNDQRHLNHLTPSLPPGHFSIPQLYNSQSPKMATVEHCLYCFESLAANLEKRTPMTLYQVSSSWADYPKGLEDDVDVPESEPEAEDDDLPSDKASSRPRNPTIDRLSASRSGSGSSTPASSSSTSSLAPSTAATTPTSSETSFVPVGIHPRRTNQRASSITESPLFVTWNTVSSSGSRSLRGCIGTFEVHSSPF